MEEKEKTSLWLSIIDILMIILATVNILWLSFDWLFSNELFQNTLQLHSASFYEFYLPYHDEKVVAFIDLIFISIFLTEFMFQWLYSIVKKTFDAWFVYPFVHWYDLLGCIPLASFRWMRLIRVVGLLYRLHKRGVISLTNNYLFRKIDRVKEIIFEELSDRVAVKVLDEIESEIKNSGDLIKKSVNNVIDPHKENIRRVILDKAGKVSSHILINNKEDIKDFSRSLASDIVKEVFDEWLILRPVKPGVAKTADIVVSQVMTGAIEAISHKLETLAEDENIKEISIEAFDAILEETESEEIMGLVQDIIVEVLHVIKNQVAIKQWQRK